MTSTHATVVAYNGRGVMIIGKAGAGKSGLALQLMAYGADLVADDAVKLRNEKGKIIASCPPNIAGLIEARSVGILSVKSIEQVVLEFVVDLDKTVAKRLPVLETKTILGVDIALIAGENLPNISAIIWSLLKVGYILPSE